uniref:Zinc finger matrin-type 4 n=1 Tax=Meleagris gallopavo TaxID=9103 RepID=A0A803YHW6_MELGA
MKSSDIDQELFTESYCRVCSAQLISESQRVAHYESRKHASKVRLYYMLHPIDGGCPAKKLRSENRPWDRYCQLCAAWFNNPVMAQQHYDGKKHKKNAARAELLEQLGKTLDLGELRGERTTKLTGTLCREESLILSHELYRPSVPCCQVCSVYRNQQLLLFCPSFRHGTQGCMQSCSIPCHGGDLS